MPTPKHNPQSIPLSEIPPGWRLCRESEREKLPADAKFWKGDWIYHGYGVCEMRTCSWDKFTYITATPLPESEREVEIEDEHFRLTRGPGQKFVMSHFEKEESPWIPLRERAPSESDFPIYLGKADTKQVWFWVTKDEMVLKEPLWELATHWMPGPKLPAPPPAPAKTQREKDETAFEESYKKLDLSVTTSHEVYFAALADERAHFGGRCAEEVKSEIESFLKPYEDWGSIPDYSVLRALLSPPKEGETKT